MCTWKDGTRDNTTGLAVAKSMHNSVRKWSLKFKDRRDDPIYSRWGSSVKILGKIGPERWVNLEEDFQRQPIDYRETIKTGDRYSSGPRRTTEKFKIDEQLSKT